MDTVETSMEIIADAGEGKSLAMQAIQSAKNGDCPKAEEILKKAHQSIVKAHKAHSEMLFQDADLGDLKVSMLMVHAADHLTSADLMETVAEEFIQLYKEVRHV